MTNSTTKLIPISQIRMSNDLRDGDRAVEEMVRSLRDIPLLHNIVVRPAVGGTNQYEIVCGHRRFMAVKKMGWVEIEARVVEVDDVSAEIYALEENLCRKTLDDKATKMARLKQLYKEKTKDRRGGDHRSRVPREALENGHRGRLADHPSAIGKIATLTGQSDRSVRRLARIGELGTSKLKTALSEGAVSTNEADRLAGLAPDEQDRRIDAISTEKDTRSKVSPALRRALGALVKIEKAVTKLADEEKRIVNERLIRISKMLHDRAAKAPSPGTADTEGDDPPRDTPTDHSQCAPPPASADITAPSFRIEDLARSFELTTLEIFVFREILEARREIQVCELAAKCTPANGFRMGSDPTSHVRNPLRRLVESGLVARVKRGVVVAADRPAARERHQSTNQTAKRVSLAIVASQSTSSGASTRRRHPRSLATAD